MTPCMVSNAKEWVCSSEEPETPSLMQSKRTSMDSELIRVLSKAVEDLGLAWSVQPAHGLLDEWYLKE